MTTPHDALIEKMVIAYEAVPVVPYRAHGIAAMRAALAVVLAHYSDAELTRPVDNVEVEALSERLTAELILGFGGSAKAITDVAVAMKVVLLRLARENAALKVERDTCNITANAMTESWREANARANAAEAKLAEVVEFTDHHLAQPKVTWHGRGFEDACRSIAAMTKGEQG
jgi:hypothetical protein